MDCIEAPPKGETFDITFRMTYPYDYDPAPDSKITVIFTTCEFKVIHNTNGKAFHGHPNVFILTPSVYSKEGLLRSFVPIQQIITIPHGIHPVSETKTKEQLRNKYTLPIHSFIFFHNSSLTGNKNPPYIFQSFRQLEIPNTYLILKGCDSTYQSKNVVYEQVKDFPAEIRERIYYIGEDLTAEQMAELYLLSDCYVSPYINEGFNLPVLEALYYGCQVICTEGGPTNEFAKDACMIRSQLYTGQGVDGIEHYMGKEIPKQVLLPDYTHFHELMKQAVREPKKIDTRYYKDNYSEETISTILYKTFRNLLHNRMV